MTIENPLVTEVQTPLVPTRTETPGFLGEGFSTETDKPTLDYKPRSMSSTFVRTYTTPTDTPRGEGGVQTSMDESFDGLDAGQQRDVKLPKRMQDGTVLKTPVQTIKGQGGTEGYGYEGRNDFTLVQPDLEATEIEGEDDWVIEDDQTDGLTTPTNPGGTDGGKKPDPLGDAFHQRTETGGGDGKDPNNKLANGTSDASRKVIDNAAKNTEEMAAMQIEMQNWQHQEAMNKAIMDAVNNVMKMWMDMLKETGSMVAK